MDSGMEKLFYQDTHITDFEAVVTECTPDEKSKTFLVVLNRTAFFPEEGGQIADKGTLNGEPVLDVRIHDDIIYHVLSHELTPGSKVTGRVDWTQRFDFMQQHSGEHIISGLIHQKYGYDNVGFHLGLTEVTLDFNGSLTLEQLREIEQLANQVIWKNLPVNISYPSKAKLKDMEYRSKIEIEGQVRIVEIPGTDTCACCAPHVETTGQIGMIKITNVQSHRGGIRVNILCGGRALADYSTRQDSVFAISVLLSAKQEAVASAAERLKEENLKMKERNNTLQAKLLSLEMTALPTPDETPNAVLFTGNLDNIAMRNAVNELTTRYTGYCGIFSGDSENGWHFILGSAGKDCREAAQALREAFGAKGGGSAPMIQGSVTASEEALRKFFC